MSVTAVVSVQKVGMGMSGISRIPALGGQNHEGLHLVVSIQWRAAAFRNQNLTGRFRAMSSKRGQSQAAPLLSFDKPIISVRFLAKS